MLTRGKIMSPGLYRATLVVGALVPLLFSCLAAVVVQWPTTTLTQQECSDQIRLELGLPVRMAGWQARHHGWSARLLDVLDPESGQRVVRLRDVRWERTEKRDLLQVAAAEIQEVELAACRQHLEAAVLRQRRPRVRPLHIDLADATVIGPAQPRTYVDVQIDWVPAAVRTHLATSFHLAGTSEQEPIQFVWRREHARQPRVSQFQMSTGGHSLPCRHFRAWFPAIENWGDWAVFSGKLQVRWQGEHWDATFAGRLQELELDRLVTRYFPHKLSGRCEIEVAQGQLVDGRLLQCTALVRAQEGVASRSLLEAACRHLPWQSSVGWEQVPELVRYDELAAEVAIEHGSMQVSGICHGPTADILLAAHHLQVAASRSTISTLQIVRALAPQTQWQVPASRETNLLLRWLPLPELAAGTPNYHPLRLAPEE